MTVPLNHAVLLSGDVKFHEPMEKALRQIHPVLNVSRTHPDGSSSTLKALLGPSARTGAWLFIDLRDYRTVARANPGWSVVADWVKNGGHAVAVAETPHSAKEIRELPPFPVDYFAHNQHWEAELLAPPLSAILNGEGFLALNRDAGSGVDSVAKGEAIITSPRQKRDFLDSLLQSLAEAGIQRTKRNAIGAVADELLMNAVYDAPANCPRSKYYKQRWGGANSEFDLDPGHKVLVSWKMIDGEFYFTVRDPYGSLTLDTVNKRVATFLTESTVAVTHGGSVGGGVGIYKVLRGSSLFSVYVVPDEYTEVTVSIGLGPSKVHRTKREKEIFIFFATKR